MQDAEFEEKDFEVALYHQLARDSPNVWTPGQVFEHHFGIDAALYTTHEFFRNALNRNHFPRILFLDNLNWGYVWRSYGRKRGLPTFAVNALIQAKRPQYLLGKNRTIAKHGITGQYWRFKTVLHQQSLLERLSTKVGKRAVVSYASPACHLWDDLDRFIGENKLPDNCSYVSAERMVGHKHWCYQQPGGIGVACSEPEPISEESLPRLLAQMAERTGNTDSDTDSASQSLAYFAKNVVLAVQEEAEAGSGLARAIQRRIAQIPFDDAQPDAQSFFQVAVFSELTNVLWFVVGNQSQSTEV
jgi:hypothetical protein